MFPLHRKVRGLDQKFLFNYISIEAVFTNNGKVFEKRGQAYNLGTISSFELVE